MSTRTALRSALCDWGSRQPGQPVGDESCRGVVPAAIPQMVRTRRAQGCCSPQFPQDTRLGEVRYIAPHNRGNDGCFHQGDESMTVTPAQLKL